MRKRRVGVTARSRLIVGNQATGTPQIASEIAAPLVSRTPRSTVASHECGWKRGDTTGAKTIGQRAVPRKRMSESGESSDRAGLTARLEGAHEALPQTPPGGSPLRPPAPSPSGLIFQNGGTRSRVRKPRKNRAPLTASLRSEDDVPYVRERGPLVRGASLASRWSAGWAWLRARVTARCGARTRRCLELRQGASPLKPPLPTQDSA